MWSLALVALGGSIGALCRYGVSSYMASRYSSLFPWGTFTVNIVGCLLVSFLVIKGLEGGFFSSEWKLFLVVGIGGAFTTFSSFSVETLMLMRDGMLNYAFLNIAANLILGLAAAYLGLILARIF